MAQAILLRFGLELIRAGTKKRLEKELGEARREVSELEKELGGASREVSEPERPLNAAKGPRTRRREEGQRKLPRERLREELLEAKRRLREGDWQAANLRKPGLSPRTVVDVGVDKGTPELYEAFPEAFHVLIEPLKENEPHLQEILQKYEGTYFLTGVGAKDEKLQIGVRPGGDSKKSSILTHTDEFKLGPAEERREIPITTLDALLEKHRFQPPFGLKVDTEGFDYQVIEGARNFLRETQFVIAEVNVARVYENGYSFADFIRIMDENGFSLCDILRRVGKTSPSSELKFVDAMFRKADRARNGT